MAKLTSLLQYTGSLDGISVFPMEGVDHPVARRKGGPSKEKIQTAPSCANCRRTGDEFGGRSKAASGIRKALLSINSFSDVRTHGELNKRLIPLQEMDGQSAWGERNILISKKPQLLEGFEVVGRRPFDAVVQNPVRYTLSRDLFSATMEVPDLLPGINFIPRGSYPYFKVMATLGVAPDVLWDKKLREYRPAERFAGVLAGEAQTPWTLVKAGAPATTLEITLAKRPAGNQFSLVLTVGIAFGAPGASGAVAYVKYTGSARILAMA